MFYFLIVTLKEILLYLKNLQIVKEKAQILLTTLSFHNNQEKAAEVAEYMNNNGKNKFSNSTYTSSKGGFSSVSTLGLPLKTIIDPIQYIKNLILMVIHFILAY